MSDTQASNELPDVNALTFFRAVLPDDERLARPDADTSDIYKRNPTADAMRNAYVRARKLGYRLRWEKQGQKWTATMTDADGKRLESMRAVDLGDVADPYEAPHAFEVAGALALSTAP